MLFNWQSYRTMGNVRIEISGIRQGLFIRQVEENGSSTSMAAKQIQMQSSLSVVEKNLHGGTGCVLLGRRSSACKVKSECQQSSMWHVRSFRVI